MTNEILDRMLVVTALAWQLVLPIPVEAQTTSLPEGMVALVNGTSITQGEVDAMLLVLHLPNTEQVRLAIQHRLITRVLIEQTAEKANYWNNEEVKIAIQDARVDAEVRSYLTDNIKRAPVMDVQIGVRYEEFVAPLGKDESSPRIIVARDAAAAETVRRI